jgi:hypothetical protein
MKLSQLSLLVSTLAAASFAVAQAPVSPAANEKIDATTSITTGAPASTATHTSVTNATGTPSGTEMTTSGNAIAAPSQAMPNSSASVSGSAKTATSTDPYVEKREADATAKRDYKMRKKIAKQEYKRQKAEAKSDLKAEKRSSVKDRNDSLEAEKKTAAPADKAN